jgi:hypothetical protein
MDDKLPHFYEYYGDLMAESKHCVMVGMPMFNKLMEFINRVPNECVFEGKEYGKTRDPHITVLWGVQPMEEGKAKSILQRVPGKLVATLGEVSLFENCKDDKGTFDVLKIDVQSPHLARVNETLRKTLKFENDYDGYHPHVTLAYIKPGTCREMVGDKSFVGQRFLFETFLYSNENREHSNVPMMAEYFVGQGGGYGGQAGGAVAARGWAGTYGGPETSGRIGKHPANRSATMQGNTIINTSPYDTIRPEDLKHPKFSPDEIRTGLRWEMKRMEYPDKTRAKPIVIANLEKNPKYYSDLGAYHIDGKY